MLITLNSDVTFYTPFGRLLQGKSNHSFVSTLETGTVLSSQWALYSMSAWNVHSFQNIGSCVPLQYFMSSKLGNFRISVYIFSNNVGDTSKFSASEGWCEASYMSIPTNIRRQSTSKNISRLDDLVTGICSFLLNNCMYVGLVIRNPYHCGLVSAPLAFRLSTFYHSTSGCSGPGSSGGVATGYGLDGPGIESRWGRDFSHTSRPALGAHPAYCTMGTGSFPGVKRPGRGAGHPPLPSAEVENE
jgi:hypothetical protein